jgi:hypothetical protein
MKVKQVPKNLPLLKIIDYENNSETVCIKRGYLMTALTKLQIIIAHKNWQILEEELNNMIMEIKGDL